MILRGNGQKTPLAQSLQKLGQAKAEDATQGQGKTLPCTVTAVISPGIVTVSFDVATNPAPLPKATMAVAKPPYIQYPIQIGDIGIAVPADVRTGNLTGLGGGTPSLTDTVGNLSGARMTFVWMGKKEEIFVNPQAVTLLEPTGNCRLQISPSGAFIDGENGNLSVSGNISAGTGASGSFVTADGLTVTVQDGIITNIY